MKGAHLQPDLFEVDLERDLDITGMVHADDPPTSIDAAKVIARRRNELHEKVLAAFARYGSMTDEELETLPEFHDYGPSTIRKRRSELFQQDALIAVGAVVNTRGRTMLVWALAVATSRAEVAEAHARKPDHTVGEWPDERDQE